MLPQPPVVSDDGSESEDGVGESEGEEYYAGEGEADDDDDDQGGQVSHSKDLRAVVSR